MIKAIKTIIQDIKTGENLENYLFILAAIIVATLSILESVPQAVIDSVTLAILALIIYREIETKRFVTSMRLPQNIQFYHDRTNLPPIEERLQSSTHEIILMGLQLGNVAHNHLPLLERKARSGCSIKLLMMSPVDENGKKLPWVDEVGRVHTFVDLEKMLRTNILHLKHWVGQIADEPTRAKIEIRLYTTIPTGSLLFIDKDKPHGSVKVEPLIFDIPPLERPSFLVKRTNASDLFERLVESFNKLWSGAYDINEISIQ